MLLVLPSPTGNEDGSRSSEGGGSGGGGAEECFIGVGGALCYLGLLNKDKKFFLIKALLAFAQEKRCFSYL